MQFFLALVDLKSRCFNLASMAGYEHCVGLPVFRLFRERNFSLTSNILFFWASAGFGLFDGVFVTGIQYIPNGKPSTETAHQKRTYGKDYVHVFSY